MQRVTDCFRWLALYFPNSAARQPGDEQAWGVITGLFALAAVPPAAASVLEQFEVGFWMTIVLYGAVSFTALIMLVLLLRHRNGNKLYLDSANQLYGRMLLYSAIAAFGVFSWAHVTDVFRSAADEPYPTKQTHILLSKPVPLVERIDRELSIISGPLSRGQVKSLQAFVDRLVFQESFQSNNPDKLKVCWSAPFPANYSSIDCELFAEAASGNTCLAFLAKEEIRGGVSQIALRPLYFEEIDTEGDKFLGRLFTIPRPRTGEQLLLFFPSDIAFKESVKVAIRHPNAPNKKGQQ